MTHCREDNPSKRALFSVVQFLEQFYFFVAPSFVFGRHSGAKLLDHLGYQSIRGVYFEHREESPSDVYFRRRILLGNGGRPSCFNCDNIELNGDHVRDESSPEPKTSSPWQRYAVAIDLRWERRI